MKSIVAQSKVHYVLALIKKRTIIEKTELEQMTDSKSFPLQEVVHLLKEKRHIIEIEQFYQISPAGKCAVDSNFWISGTDLIKYNLLDKLMPFLFLLVGALAGASICFLILST